MVLLKYFYLLIVYTFVLAANPLSGQIIFKNLPAKDLVTDDSLFLDIGETRKMLSLHGKWSVYQANADNVEKVSVEIPSVFEGESNLLFEKSFNLTSEEISNYRLKLVFMGINYSADISLNNISIYRHAGGEFPFSLDLPPDILHSDKANILSVKVSNKSDAQNTIPVKQKFQFPKSLGGIFRDVFIHFTPNFFISDITTNLEYNARTRKHVLTAKVKIENRELNPARDTLFTSEPFFLNLTLRSDLLTIVQNPNEIKFQLGRNEEIYLTQTFDLSSPAFWSPSNPRSYLLTVEIITRKNLIDRTTSPIELDDINIRDSSLVLNDQNIRINGVTYYPVFNNNGGLMSYKQMESDIRLIRATGFNSIRFAKKIPHPYYLTLCQRYGLLSFIDIPINDIPSSILGKKEFYDRAFNYVNSFLAGFKNYNITGVGLGSSYNFNSPEDINFIEKLAAIVKKKTNAITYASFIDGEIKDVKNLDYYGIELYSKPIASSALNQLLTEDQIQSSKVFISEASYIVSRGQTNGYLNDNSYEAQAKFFDDVIDYSNEKSLLGYFLNCMFDYRSEYASVISGYSKEDILHLGLADENRDTDRMSFKVIYAKLNGLGKVTIPLGNKKDDSPMLFIIVGIVIAIIMGVMINSGKKFREDSSRALLRPYNFFADIRDQRLISGFHTFIMILIIAATSGLLLSNILYYLKENIIFEKVLLSFGSKSLLQEISYLAWNPLISILWLSLFTLLFLIALILIVKGASFFVRTRVAFSSVFHVVIWSFLPLVILVPLGIILYRLLNVETISLYIFLAMLLFTIWVFYRLLKGIYVIFDTNPGNVYFYSLIILFVIAASFVIYFQVSNSTFTYIIHELKNYKILG